MISPSWPSIGRRAFALPGTQPVVPLEAHGLAQDGHELVLDEPIDLGAVLLIEMVMTGGRLHGRPAFGEKSKIAATGWPRLSLPDRRPRPRSRAAAAGRRARTAGRNRTRPAWARWPRVGPGAPPPRRSSPCVRWYPPQGHIDPLEALEPLAPPPHVSGVIAAEDVLPEGIQVAPDREIDQDQ